ncbi:disease susceptibility protein LOV1-like [Hibiscus syriacus]|uniref:disease susceptibility protein LOV1-like n=1 Tax=Hibiscus syriacus TaxID=106335 RepID=UPI0019212230|nr:disease susceptibility protein LOV1-like [Hibiscus syriacus]
MAWSAVASAVTTIGKLLTDEAVYLWGVEKQVDRLQTKLKWMQSLLLEADVKQHDDERIRLLVAEIRELAYDAEDVIEDFALRIGSKKKAGLSGCIKRSACLLKDGWTLHETRSKIEEIFEKILDLLGRLQVYGVKGLRDGDGSSSFIAKQELRRPYPHIIDQNYVERNDGDIEKLVSELVEGTQFKVVSIWGMGGLGKTTLAKKLYHHSRVTSRFEHRAFVFVSQQFQTRKVWKDILSDLGKLGENDGKLTDVALASKLFNLLKDEKCLVTLDDVWSSEAWDRLKPAFPVARGIHSNSKILLTSRNKEIVSQTDASVYLYELPILNDEESWELFQKIAFPSDSTDKTVDGEIKEFRQDKGKRRADDTVDGEIKELGQDKGRQCADDTVDDKKKKLGQDNGKRRVDDTVDDKKKELGKDEGKQCADDKKKELGKVMVEQCGGLPLAIILLGGILANKSSLDEWQKVSENVKSYLNRSKVQGQGTREVLALSYDDLPAHLRSCFLYLSHFPEDYQIEAERLIQLWVAEGIVSSTEEGDGEWGVAEDVAENYLMELAERCMIQVRDRDVVTSKVETIQMHDLIRDLCLSKAKEENFVFIVDESNAFSLSTIRKVRRVSMHELFETKYIRCPNLRSLSFFNKRHLRELFEVETPSACTKSPFSRLHCFWDILAAYISFLKARGFWVHIFINLKLIRVLNYEGRKTYADCKLIGDIGNLIHLRFLSLVGIVFRSTKLPSSLGNLRCLQTLDLQIREKDIHVPDVIWRMEELRHLYLPYCCDDKTKLRLDTLRKLLTLVNFKTKNCYLKDLSNMTKLRELLIQGPFEIEDFNEELDNNPPIIRSKYLHTLYIFSERIDIRHLTCLLSSCVSICKLTIRAVISKLPEHLSSNLAYIRLENCKLQEDPMPTLEKLPNLRFLKFVRKPFIGKQMCCSAQGFPKLESLSLCDLKMLEQWKVDKGAMPCLRQLEIENCEKLKMLPDELRFITTLQELETKKMPKEFHDKVVQGGQDSDEVQDIWSYSRTYKRRYTTNSEGGDRSSIWI